MNGHECYVIGAGDFFGLREIPDDSDYVIAADAGYKYCREAGIIPDLVIGDFDSLGDIPEHPNIVRLPAEKDDTDMLFALKLGIEKGYRHFFIYGGTGGKRPDHGIANLQSLQYLANHACRGWLFGENEVWTVIKNTSLRLNGEGAVSVFCIDGKAEGVYLKGLKYPLDNATVTSDFPIGVSNELLMGEAEVTVVCGSLLVMYSRNIGETD